MVIEYSNVSGKNRIGLLRFAALFFVSAGMIVSLSHPSKAQMYRSEIDPFDAMSEEKAVEPDEFSNPVGLVPAQLPVSNGDNVGTTNVKIKKGETSEFTPPGTSSAELDSGGVTKSPDAPAPDLYYDSNTIPSVTNLSRDAGPRKPDPRKEPGSKFIVVENDYGAESIQAQMVSAERAIKLGRYDSAAEIYERLKKKNPRDQKILMGLAVAYQKSGQSEAAIGVYEKLLKIYPGNHEAEANLLGLMRLTDPANALSRLLKLKEKDPSNYSVAAQIGLVHADLGNYGDAARYLGMAVGMRPDDALLAYNLAVVVDMAGDRKQAASLYRRALEIDAMQENGSVLSRGAVYDRLAVLSN